MNDGSANGTVIVLNRDLMFGSKIASAVKLQGFEPVFVRDTAAFVTALRDAGGRAALGVIDMNGVVDWDAISGLTAADGIDTPLLGFGPHVDVEGRRAAKAAGLRRILSNGEFHRETAEMIGRYARRTDG
jgi:hypothetical protein